MFKKLTDDGAALSPPLARRTAPGLGAGSGMIWLDPAAGDGRPQPTLTIIGSVTGAADVAINSRIVGDVAVTRLTLDEGGVIEGSVTAEQVEIRGRVKGEIRAAAVRLCAKAVVEGDITAGTLAIDLGADFQGAVRRMPAPAAPPLVAHAEPAPAMSAKAALEAIAIDPARTPTPVAAPDRARVN